MVCRQFQPPNVIFFAASFVNLLSDNAIMVVVSDLVVAISTTKCNFFAANFVNFPVIDAFEKL
jgi:hypothetical protein